MSELLKSKIQQAVNLIVRVDTNIAKELLDIYKESLVNSTCDIFAALSDMYESSEELERSIELFVKENFESEKPKFKGYHTDGYLVASVPVLIPIECVGIVDAMDDVTLPLIISQLSSILLRSIFELRELDKLEDKLLEHGGERLAEALKEKGWIA